MVSKGEAQIIYDILVKNALRLGNVTDVVVEITVDAYLHLKVTWETVNKTNAERTSSTKYFDCGKVEVLNDYISST